MKTKTKETPEVKIPHLRKGLKDSVINLIKDDKYLIIDLVIASDTTYPTIMRWLRNNSENLTRASIVDAICAKLRLTKEDVLFNH